MRCRSNSRKLEHFLFFSAIIKIILTQEGMRAFTCPKLSPRMQFSSKEGESNSFPSFGPISGPWSISWLFLLTYPIPVPGSWWLIASISLSCPYLFMESTNTPHFSFFQYRKVNFPNLQVLFPLCFTIPSIHLSPFAL